MTSSSPGGALPARHSSLKTHTTHTHQEMASINTHTHSGWGNNHHRRGYTKTHAHARKWATSTAGCRSVCKHKHMQAHTAKHSYKPEITLSVHVNLTPPIPPCTMTSGSLSLVTESFNPPLQRGSPSLGDTMRQAWGSWMGRKGPWDTGGKRQQRTQEGQSYPQSE